MLDQREQFSRSIGGRQHNRVDALTECSRQLSNLGISVEVKLPCMMRACHAHSASCAIDVFHVVKRSWRGIIGPHGGLIHSWDLTDQLATSASCHGGLAQMRAIGANDIRLLCHF